MILKVINKVKLSKFMYDIPKKQLLWKILSFEYFLFLQILHHIVSPNS